MPLIVLALLAMFGGAVHLPLDTALPHAEHPDVHFLVIAAAVGLPLFGILVGYLFYGSRKLSAEAVANSTIGKPLAKFFNSGWGMDWLYCTLLVKPFIALAKTNKNDLINLLPNTTSVCAQHFNRLLSMTQNGQLRFYVGVMGAAAMFVIAIVVFL